MGRGASTTALDSGILGDYSVYVRVSSHNGRPAIAAPPDSPPDGILPFTNEAQETQ
jgi:hypothetical protein